MLEKRFPNVSDEDFSRIFEDAYMKGRRDGIRSVKNRVERLVRALMDMYLILNEENDE